jgi:hypothetical protein
MLGQVHYLLSSYFDIYTWILILFKTPEMWLGYGV